MPNDLLHGGSYTRSIIGISSFNLERDVLLCGEVAINPCPKGKKSRLKYPCSEFHKAVRNNQDAILCATCGNWSHAKCPNMSRTIFQYYLDRPDIEWNCPACALPQLTDSFFEEVSEGDTLILKTPPSSSLFTETLQKLSSIMID